MICQTAWGNHRRHGERRRGELRQCGQRLRFWNKWTSYAGIMDNCITSTCTWSSYEKLSSVEARPTECRRSPRVSPQCKRVARAAPHTIPSLLHPKRRRDRNRRTIVLLIRVPADGPERDGSKNVEMRDVGEQSVVLEGAEACRRRRARRADHERPEWPSGRG